jgi:hypothetical protein
VTEKAISQNAQLWAYEAEESTHYLEPGRWIVYRDSEKGGRLRVGLIRGLYPDEGICVVAYDEYGDIELEGADIVGPARAISSRSELRR